MSRDFHYRAWASTDPSLSLSVMRSELSGRGRHLSAPWSLWGGGALALESEPVYTPVLPDILCQSAAGEPRGNAR